MAAENGQRDPGLGRSLAASMRPRRMAAENPASARRRGRGGARFNEAAAHGRGKRWPPGRGRRWPPGFNEAAAHGRGKRRGVRGAGLGSGRFNEAAAHGRGKPSRKAWTRPPRRASMRPRRMAAENFIVAFSRDQIYAASMRPRRMAAENLTADEHARPARPGFNEAAAHGRGKPSRTSSLRRRNLRFNEAAAHGRGKLAGLVPTRRQHPGFNEAAAHGRGKRRRQLRFRADSAGLQ